jgi:hypothetical protein
LPLDDHPANLLLRWFLDLAALASVGLWGWSSVTGWSRPFVAVLLPLTMIAVLGIFAVPSDPIRSGYATVPVPGAVRLVLEAAAFAVACLALADLGHDHLAVGLAAGAAAHFAIAHRRVRWLLHQ